MEVRQGERVILWGDSLGKGVIWNEQRGRYGYVSVNAVQVVAGRMGITIENRSRFGSTAPQGLELIERDIGHGLRADAAVLEFGGNDCNFDWACISAAPEAQHDPATPPERFLDTLRQMVATLRTHGIRPILMTLPPINAERYFHFLVGDNLNGDNILRWLGDVHRIYRFQEMYSSMAVRVARELNSELIDLRTRCLATPDFVTRLLCADGLHMNEDGQRFAGNEVTSLLLAVGA